jgi:DNA replication protein DnaC
VREQRRLTLRTNAAEFRSLKTLEDFDWRFNLGIPRKEIYELAACHFIRKATDALFVGPPGTGKTHLAQAIGYEALKQGFLVRYRSIFDLVADFLSEEALQHRDKTLKQYLKPDLLIIDSC